MLQAADAAEALRLKPNRLAVVRRGRVIATTPPRIGALRLEGRPDRIDGGIAYRPNG